jgi:hypothetical protein
MAESGCLLFMSIVLHLEVPLPRTYVNKGLINIDLILLQNWYFLIKAYRIKFFIIYVTQFLKF